ncbi:MAX gene-associated protein isoform X3 [Ascaphus truei]|uniref:MAX gene-associated protein isoform X3 n=1 Tax=Ascaphus truei TaxID=8439 RepID=UPI003F5AA3C9
MEEEQQQQTPPEDQEHNVTMPATTPAFFVILQKSQGNGKTDEGILVANRDVSSVAQIVPPGPGKSKAKTFLSADCTSGEITVTLDNNNMWNEFYRCSTEMVLTKQGRRMFPYCRYWITGLDPYLKYILLMDISPVDNNRYKWNGRWWEPGGKSEPHVLGRVFIHPESPSTGQFWMHQPVSFYKLKLTNNTLDQEGHIILHSMHRYLPRLHVVPAEKATEVIQLNGPDVHTFTFPQTEFFAVTAYQNFQITQLKIDCNPFAKGFREGAMMGRPLKDMRPKNTNQGVGSPSSKTQMKLDDLEFRQKIREQIRATDHSGGDLETEAFIAERDFLNFLDPHSELEDIPSVREDDLESPVPSSFKSISRVASPLNPHGKLNIVIKEEPVDEYDYGMEVGTEGLDVKQESSAEEETDEYSNSDDDYPILERQQRRQSAQYRTAPHSPRKRSLGSPSGVAKAKMLKLDSGKMPVVYLEPCSVPKSIVRTSDLPDNILSLERLRSALVHSTKSTELKPPEYSSPSIGQGASRNDKSKSNHKAECVTTKDKLSSSQVSNVKKTKLPLLLPKASLNETTAVHRISTPSVPSKRGRPRKVTKTGRHTKKSYGKTGIATRNPIETPPPFPDVNPDLEDVDGVLFVAFASKEALDVHTGGGPMKDVTSSFPVLPISNGEKEIIRKIPPLQRQLLVHLKTLRHKQVIHPSLQQVGLKLNSVDPATTIDLKYLGVQLPLPYFTSKSRWDNYGSCAHASGSPFVSRTGKTDDYTKIKGWRDKFSTNSITSPTKHDGSSSESSLKNRSAFCSDKLDEYLENEAKLMENCTGPSSSEPVSSIVYQFPTKSTSYVRTLDSVLKKQFALPKSSSYAFKPLSLPSSTNQAKRTREASAPKLKSVFKPILPSPVTVKEKPRVMKPAKSLSVAAQADVMEVNCVLPGSPQAQLQNQQPTILRPFGLSKAQVKLLDLEECAVWEGKPRTYVTMERADISLTTLLTAQASLKSKPIHKIIRKHAPPCNNEFCRLGCVCASLAHAKRKSTHCRRLGCMFGCSCLKRKVFLVKRGVELKKTTSKKSVQGSLAGEEPLSQSQEEDQEGVEDEGDSEEMKTKKPIMEYTVCDSEPEPPVQSFPIWDKWGENRDLEPIYVPTPACLEHNEVHSPQPAALQQPVKTKSSGASKPARVYTPKPKPAQ